MIALQPGSTRPVIERVAARTELSERFALFEQQTSFALDALSPLAYVRALRVPTLMAQLRGQPDDAQSLYDALAAKHKDLLWLEGAGRLDALAQLVEQPAPLLAFLRGQRSEALELSRSA